MPRARMIAAVPDVGVRDQIAHLIADAVTRQKALGLGVALDSELYVAAVRRSSARWSSARPDGPAAPNRTRPVLAELDRVCVAPTARGQGVGRALVDLLTEDAARPDNVHLVGSTPIGAESSVDR